MKHQIFKILRILLTLSAFFCVISCKRSKIEIVERQLMKKFKDDSVKRESGLLVLENLKNSVHFEGYFYDQYLELISKYHNNGELLEQKVSEFEQRRGPFKLEKDLDILSNGYLINDINNVFNTMHKVKWRTRINDADLLNILSYKINNSSLESWRDSVHKDFGYQVFDFDQASKAAEYLVNETTKRNKDFKVYSNSTFPDLPYSSLKKLSFGSCKELSDYISYILRAYAIPCYQDFTPNYTNIHSGHFWNAIKNESGKIVPFVIPLEVDTLGHFKSEHYRLGKVYRKTYFKNLNSHSMLFGKKPYLPEFLNNEYIQDVTEEYVKTSDISIPIISTKSSYHRAYLSVFNNQEWVPIAWGRIDQLDGNAIYKNVGKESLYLPVSIDENGSTNLNYPFILHGDKKIDIKKPDINRTLSLNILRKYPLVDRVKYFINRVNGGFFQVANDKKFSDAITIHTVAGIDEEYFTEINVNLRKQYRYIRYVSPPGSYCNISELEFYGGNNMLKGEIIGTEGTFPLFPDRTKESAFDGEVLTFNHAPVADNAWIGLDLGKSTDIDRIRFLPRVAYNIIVPGNTYELFYWDNTWVSLGRKVATDNLLNYENVPSNAVYFLRNHSGGNEERIFTYENDRQIWW